MRTDAVVLRNAEIIPAVAVVEKQSALHCKINVGSIQDDS